MPPGPPEPPGAHGAHGTSGLSDQVRMDDKRSEEIKTALGSKSTTKLPDLSQNTSEPSPAQENEETEAQIGGTTESNGANTPFNLEDVKNALSRFGEVRKKAGKIQEQSLYKQEIDIQEDNTIILTLNNSVQEDILSEVLQDLVQFLRRELKNDSILLRTELSKEETSSMIYTNKEKLEHLASKNPLVKEMQEKLGLDPEF